MKQLGIFLRANKVLHFILVGVGCKRVQTMGTQVLALCVPCQGHNSKECGVHLVAIHRAPA